MEAAYIMINCEMGKESSIIDQLKPIKDIKEIHSIYGNYDIIAKLECASVECMRDIIVKQIRVLKDVHCTTTVICTKPSRTDED
ncbi:MAG: Lrp/AsnC ligand binding domain-containing protein [Thaumarchaeota archaeon]|nr:Lrp/AsnC ligand binding domain-containing protein [Nitrososphaerota archaeon]